MRLMHDKSVHLIITSPPYWQLKDYGNDGQIGFNDSYETYINNLNLVWSECNRILKDGCFLVEFAPEENADNFEMIYNMKKT